MSGLSGATQGVAGVVEALVAAGFALRGSVVPAAAGAANDDASGGTEGACAPLRFSAPDLVARFLLNAVAAYAGAALLFLLVERPTLTLLSAARG